MFTVIVICIDYEDDYGHTPRRSAHFDRRRPGAPMSRATADPARVSASPGEEVTLRRGAIGLPGAIAGTLSNMAPVEGIFIVLVLVAAGMGTLTPWAFLIGAAGIL